MTARLAGAVAAIHRAVTVTASMSVPSVAGLQLLLRAFLCMISTQISCLIATTAMVLQTEEKTTAGIGSTEAAALSDTKTATEAAAGAAALKGGRSADLPAAGAGVEAGDGACCSPNHRRQR